MILPFLQLLNEKTAVEVLEERIETMSRYDYHCVGVFDKGRLIAISGVWVLYKFYIGKHIEPDNVVVHPDYRGKQVGEQMMNWIHDYAKKNDCAVSELNVYIANGRGQKFWFEQGYRIIGFHMRKDLTESGN